MKISARNQFEGKISDIKEGVVNSLIKVKLTEDISITSTISVDAVKDLGLSIGKEVVAIIKATEVIISIDKSAVSARNKLVGKIIEIKEGAINGIVKIQVAKDVVVSSTISLEAIKDLELAIGKEVTAVIKATSVLIAC